ncbi:MAG: L,D-transpeptidase family protein [Endozoicomonas sp. (ex Botrylloides leachii)]|nr:L,D-transpeptidase family protein [Endozoicomonas sp. (ex Botrylloides leachii)]
MLVYRYSLICIIFFSFYSSASTLEKDRLVTFFSSIESHGFSIDKNDWLSLVKDSSTPNLQRLYKKYMTFIDLGRLNKTLFQNAWEIPDIETHFGGGNQFLPIEQIQSKIPAYQMLRKALRDLKQWRETALQLFPDDIIFFEGDTNMQIAKLGDWLVDIDLINHHLGSVYLKQHLDVLTQVQLEYNLMPDGRFGPSTRQALLSITNKRIKMLKANLERLRWLPQKIHPPYVWVDIPGFTVSWIDAQGKKYHHRAIVGKPANKTPILQDEISTITINPVWKVPHRIAAHRLLRSEQKSPGLLKKEGFLVYESWDDKASVIDAATIQWAKYSPKTFTFRLEQQPGENNRLGKYRFNIMNKQSIYLHDTNDRTLFDKKRRMFSSGCIRVDGSDKFFSYLISTQDAVISQQSTGTTLKIPLNKPVDVYLSYFTAWPDSNGRVRFRDDIYNYDEPLVSWF